MNQNPYSLAATAKRFMAVGPSFGLVGLLIALASHAQIGRVSETATRAVMDMLALNALVFIAIAAMLLTGAVSLAFGRPKESWGPIRKGIVYYFSTRPAEFVADFSAPMFWFFLGAALAMAFTASFGFAQLAVFALFLASVAIIGFVTALYVHVLHSPGLVAGWRWARSGRIIGAILVAGAAWLVYLLPVLPANGR